MIKKLTLSIFATSMTIFLVTACAEEVTESNAAVSDTETTQLAGQQDANVMNQPVDFSSPEAVEKSLQNIREKEGDKAAEQLENAMQYMMVYDLSLRNDKQKLHQKLNGMTPKEIVASVRR